MPSRATQLLCVIALGLALTTAHAAAADAYPQRPIRLIIPFPPGGPRDVVARALGPKLTQSLGQNIIVDNRAGANGIVGSDLAARAAPDGYTLLLLSSGHAVSATLYPKLPYDSVRDFAFISALASGPGILVINPALPPRSVRELVDYVKARPGKLFYASSGNGAPSHLAAELFKLVTHTDMVHVPYKGMAGAMNDLIAGQVQVSIPTIPAGLPHARTGRLRALAVTGTSRSAAAPELPTVIEAGVPGYTATNWYGLAAPARLPQAIVTRLNAEIRVAMQAPEVTGPLAGLGLDAMSSSPEEFARFVQGEVAKWGKVIKAAGLRPD